MMLDLVFSIGGAIPVYCVSENNEVPVYRFVLAGAIALIWKCVNYINLFGKNVTLSKLMGPTFVN
jgi:hypothetical protein